LLARYGLNFVVILSNDFGKNSGIERIARVFSITLPFEFDQNLGVLTEHFNDQKIAI
jgi:hypothetical protein